MNLSEIIQATNGLQEYEKKQLAIILMTQTLSPITVDQTIEYIAPDPKPYDIKINWADGFTIYKDKSGATIKDSQSEEKETITDIEALNEALRYF